ncbi:MAG: T9SS type A sorting domain-containing protein [Chitinophagales bacterium]|nr:T9SS type A sorting domain-containing protein [Chitinophagales bacterium]MDW8393277.1 T9SS type A sorting domain-containing protein [Chitinophagales bacterium]
MAQTVNCPLLEPNNNHTEAIWLPPDTAIRSTIAYAGDHDFYKFIVPHSKPNLKATLSDFEKNYNLWLLNDKGLRIAKATSPKKIDEIIIFNLAVPDTYFLVVFHPKNAYDENDCYLLQYHLSEYQFRTADAGLPEVYPNPASTQLFVPLSPHNGQLRQVELLSAAGLVIRPLSGCLDQNLWKCNVSTVPKGWYLLRMEFDSGQVRQVPVVIVH